MNEDNLNGSGHVTLRDYVDGRFTAIDNQTKLALETVKVAMDNTAKADSQRLTMLISVLSLIVSVAFGVFMLARHT
jgi:hypothetical protein